ncbi:MAG: hypothetical protein HZA04_02815 [Nitrospinae bacterium]|nr:hypothetical protein [Nitrospinota bacterium]
MEEQVHLWEKDRLKFMVKALWGLVVVLIIALVWNSYSVRRDIDRALKESKTIIMTADMLISYEAADNNLSDDYIRKMVTYILAKELNFDPLTARGGFEELLKLYSDAEKDNAIKKYYEMAKLYEEKEVVSFFNPVSYKVDSRQAGLVVQGRRRLSIKGKPQPDGEESWLIRFKIENARFQLLSVIQVEGK